MGGGGKKTAWLIGGWFSVLKNVFFGVKTSLVLVEVLKEQSPWKVPVQQGVLLTKGLH